MKFFGREVTLIAGGKEVSKLRVQFRATKTLDQKPNAIEIAAWNLSAETRAAAARPDAKVLLSAGYQGAQKLLFAGDMDLVTHERQGPDWITRMQAGDGLTAIRLGRIFEALSPGQMVHDVIRRMAEQMKVGLGNSLRAVAKGKPGEAVTSFINGIVFEGSVHEEFNRVARALGYDWSIQDGQLHFIEPGKPDEREAVVLAPDSGLIGSPLMAVKESQGVRRDIVRCRSLLNADISPGRALRVEGQALKAWCRVESVVHVGDTHGPDWYTDIEAAPL